MNNTKTKSSLVLVLLSLSLQVGAEESAPETSGLQQLFAAYGETPKNTVAAVASTANPAPNPDGPVQVECRSLEGSFSLTGYPALNKAWFKLEKTIWPKPDKHEKIILEDSFDHFCPTRVPCRHEFIATKDASGIVSIQVNKLSKVWIPEHEAGCTPRSRLCEIVPEGYVWHGQTITLQLLPFDRAAGRTHQISLFYFQNYGPHGDGPMVLGNAAYCKVKGI